MYITHIQHASPMVTNDMLTIIGYIGYIGRIAYIACIGCRELRQRTGDLLDDKAMRESIQKIISDYDDEGHGAIDCI